MTEDLRPAANLSQQLFMSLSRRTRLCCLTMGVCFYKPQLKSLSLPAPPSCLGCSQVKSKSSFSDPRFILTMLQEFPIQRSDNPGTHSAGITTGRRLCSSKQTKRNNKTTCQKSGITASFGVIVPSSRNVHCFRLVQLSWNTC